MDKQTKTNRQHNKQTPTTTTTTTTTTTANYYNKLQHQNQQSTILSIFKASTITDQPTWIKL
jgi:hypothetical protein